MTVITLSCPERSPERRVTSVIGPLTWWACWFLVVVDHQAEMKPE
ncbi:hypothetical protein [Thermalbibacter longus]|nr:hypothetical protein [Thermalbibacter longus]